MKTPRGRDAAVLYLDYDGVLSPADVWWHPRRGAYINSPDGHNLFENVPLLERALEPHPHVVIVLSTSWTRHLGHARAARRLSPALRRRVIGSTYHTSMDAEAFAALPRWFQITQDAARRRVGDWLAVDDDCLGWPDWCNEKLVATHEVNGISEPSVFEELKCKLTRFSSANVHGF